MIKYVHYEGSLLDSSAMISDNENETAKGYHLYMEVDTPYFERILSSVTSHLPKFKPFVIGEDGICNYSANTIKGHMMCLLASDRALSAIPYRIKIHQDGKVAVYAREIEGGCRESRVG